MALQAYIRDISEYLTSGNFSDLSVVFGEKTWNVHKAIVCSHSQWFRKAMTNDFKESSSGIVTLNDAPEFADAVDCMLSYFYRADYNASGYDASAPLLHARVAVIADRYACASLYELAKTSLASCIGTAEVQDWVAIAALVYSCTTSELSAHRELRNLVVRAVPDHPDVLESFFGNKDVEDVLRSTADLGADLLLSRMQQVQARNSQVHILTCDHCHYVHAGSLDCPAVVCGESTPAQTCPQCGKGDKTIIKRHVGRVLWPRAQPCPSCEGVHISSSQDAVSERRSPFAM